MICPQQVTKNLREDMEKSVQDCINRYTTSEGYNKEISHLGAKSMCLKGLIRRQERPGGQVKKLSVKLPWTEANKPKAGQKAEGHSQEQFFPTEEQAY